MLIYSGGSSMNALPRFAFQKNNSPLPRRIVFDVLFLKKENFTLRQLHRQFLRQVRTLISGSHKIPLLPLQCTAEHKAKEVRR